MSFNTSGALAVPLGVLGSWVTDMPAQSLPEGVSGDCQDVIFYPGAVASRNGLEKYFSIALPAGGPDNIVPTVVYNKSFVSATKTIFNLYFDSNGVMWVENWSNTPGTYTQLFQSTPGSYCRTITAFGREWIAISDGLHGADIAYWWDGTTLGKVTQDSPGIAPTVANVALPAVQMTDEGIVTSPPLSPPAGAATLSRVNNTVTCYTATPHNLQVGYQAQISNVPDAGSSIATNENSSNQDVDGTWWETVDSGVQWRTTGYATSDSLTSPLSAFVATGFNFSIPSNAVIVGAQATMVIVSQASTTATVAQVALWYNGAQLGTAKSPGTAFTTSEVTQSYGNSSDTWGTSLTPAIVNSSSFGFAVSCSLSNIRVFLTSPFTVEIFYQTSSSTGISEIESIVVNNELYPGQALVTTQTPHGLVPGIDVTLTGINPTTVATIDTIENVSSMVTINTVQAHNLVPGALITVANVTNGGGYGGTYSFNGTFVVAQIPSPTQITYAQALNLNDPDVIQGTPNTGTITLSWPVPDNTPTPTYYEVLSCPTSTTFYVQLNYSDATWGASGRVGFSWEGTFRVTGVESAYEFQYYQPGPDAATNAIGTVTPFGQIAPGLHLCQLIFQLQDGTITAPGPPVSFIANGGQYLQVSFGTGPNDVASRILAFTGAQPNVPGELPPFYYLAVPPQLEGQVVGTATQVNDNTTETLLLDFSDQSLFGSAAGSGAISIVGNNLANQIVLDGALAFSYFNSRLTTWGQRNRVDNFECMSFGGCVTGGVPGGWTVPPGSVGGGVSLGQWSGIWTIVADSADTPGTSSLIQQGAYEDWSGTPILDGQKTYKVRFELVPPVIPGTYGPNEAQTIVDIPGTPSVPWVGGSTTVPPTPFTYIREATVNANNTCTFGENTAGSMLVIGCVQFGAAGAGSFPLNVVDSAGNTYTKVYDSSASSYTQIVYYAMYVCPSCVASGGANTFASPVTASVYNAVMGVEYTYFNNTATLDASSAIAQMASSVGVSGAQIGDLAIDIGLSVAGTWTPDPSANTRYGNTGDLLWQDKIMTATSLSLNTTPVGGVGHTAYMVAYNKSNSVPSTITTDKLDLTEFLFGVPLVSTISGITAEIPAYASASGSVLYAQLLVGGVPVGTPKSIALGTSPTTITLGSASDLWGASLTPAEINSNNFGLQLYVVTTGATLASPVTNYLDANTVTLTVNVVTAAEIADLDIVFFLSSASTSFLTTATFNCSTLTTWQKIHGGWFEATFAGATPTAIPTDLQFGLYGLVTVSSPPTAATIGITELSVIPVDNPYTDSQINTSYVNNPTGFDGDTGNGQPSEDTHKIMDMSILRGSIYAHTQDPAGRLHEIIPVSNLEPSDWGWREVQSNCGTLSAFCVTHSQADDQSSSSGDDWVSWASESGALLFEGSEARKISQEIQPNWSDPQRTGYTQINMAAALTISSVNDPVSKMLYFFLPVGEATAPNIAYVLSYRNLNNAAAIESNPPFHPSLAGKLIATDNTRKWTRMNMSINYAARMYIESAGQLSVVFCGGNGLAPGVEAGFGNVYTFSPAKYSDDDYGQIYPYYTTCFFLDMERANQMGLNTARLQLAYINAAITGIGVVNYSFLVDNLSNPWSITTTRTLTSEADFDQELAGGDAQGNRIAIKIASYPDPMASPPTLDNSFSLARIQYWWKRAKLLVRGASK